MSEHELQQENERLRLELAKMTTSRERVMGWLCQTLRFEPLTDQEVEELVKVEGKPIDDLLREVLPTGLHYLIEEDCESPQNGVVAAPGTKT